MTQPPLDVISLEFDLFENLRVGFEADESSVRLASGLAFFLVLEFPLLEEGFDKFALAKTADQKLPGKRIHCLSADPIEPEAELKHDIVVFGSRIDLPAT